MGVPTPNLGLLVPTIGGDAGPVFAQEINADLYTIDAVCGGVNTLGVGGSSNVTATAVQAHNLVQQLTGTLTGSITYFLPAIGAFYAIENATSGNFFLSVGCTGGTNTLIIPQGFSVWVWTDGTTIRLSNPPGWQEIATYTVSNAASQVVLLPAPFRRFRLTMQGISFTANGAALALQFSSNGGSSFLNSGYNFVIPFSLSSGTSGITTSTTAIQMQITSSEIVPAGGNNLDATIEIFPGSTNLEPRVRGSSYSIGSGSTYIAATIAGGWFGAGQLMNAIQIFAIASGNFSGTLILEGLP